MPHSHHSHSGSYCNHATSTLRSIVSHATSQHFSTYALTEHCPHDDAYLYPGEKESGWSCEEQWVIFERFVREARGLRREWEGNNGGSAGVAGGESECGEGAEGGEVVDATVRAGATTADGVVRGRGTKLLIGFESEWIEPCSSTKIVRELQQKYADALDFFVGSVHHVRTIPIDFDQAHYDTAVSACGGGEEARDGCEVDLFCEYFDSQMEMLRTLRPKVVGHFDLIRLMSAWERDRANAQEEARDEAWRTLAGGKVWEKIVRNLEFVRGYGGVLELNSSALRKGLSEPYPRAEIVREWDAMGGLCVLSDDCHGLEQVGTNYGRMLQFIERVGLSRIAYLDKEGRETVVRMMPIDELRKRPYWNALAKS